MVNTIVRVPLLLWLSALVAGCASSANKPSNPNAVPANRWALIGPPISRESDGREYVKASAPRADWVVLGGTSFDDEMRCGQVLKASYETVGLRELNCPDPDTCRVYKQVKKQYELAKCQESDGGARFLIRPEMRPGDDLVR